MMPLDKMLLNNKIPHLLMRAHLDCHRAKPTQLSRLTLKAS